MGPHDRFRAQAEGCFSGINCGHIGWNLLRLQSPIRRHGYDLFIMRLQRHLRHPEHHETVAHRKKRCRASLPCSY